MKKILFTLACLLGIGMAASAFNNSAVVLLHNGNATTYEANQINDAMEAAQDGDVVMLSEGTYPAFDIKKKITVKGTGEMTVISGDINIDIPGTPVLTANLLEFVKAEKRVNIKAPIKGLRIKQCTLNYVDFLANTYESYIDRCHITRYLDVSRIYQETITIDGVTHTFNSPHVKGLTITNSDIYWACGTANSNIPTMEQNTTFINCYFKNLQHSGGIIINSIINHRGAEGGPSTIYNTKLINTFYYLGRFEGDIDSNCELINCYNSDTALDYTTADLASLGYLGNDGTIIGPMGGNTPYTLAPAVPTVTESSMKVDTDKQQLQVTLTVSPK